MTDLNHQKSLTSGKGWKNVFIKKVKGDVDHITTKAKNIWGGIKATPAAIKKTFKKD